MTKSALKAKFERLARTRRIDRGPSGSRAVVSLSPKTDGSPIDSVDAIVALRRAGLGMLRAKRTIEAALADGVRLVELPHVADPKALEGELARSGFAAKVRDRDAPDVRALRKRLHMTQEEFAARFGLELHAVRNWEHARRAPDPAARSLLKVIARFPDAVAEAQDS